MRRLLMTAIAATAMTIASPALADPNGAIFQDDSGPDLQLRIHASQDPVGVAPNVGPTVYGNAGSANASGHNVAFSGYSAYNTLNPTNTWTATDININEGGGFAQIHDNDFDSKVAATQNLAAILFDPSFAFTAYEFSIQLAGEGDISVYAWLTGSSSWQLITGSPIHQKDNQNNQYMINGLTSGSFDKILITTTSAIFELKQNSLNAAPGAVPEPATWAMMLLGFGGIGLAVRRNRKRSNALMQIA